MNADGCWLRFTFLARSREGSPSRRSSGRLRSGCWRELGRAPSAAARARKARCVCRIGSGRKSCAVKGNARRSSAVGTVSSQPCRKVFTIKVHRPIIERVLFANSTYQKLAHRTVDRNDLQILASGLDQSMFCPSQSAKFADAVGKK